jgi:hypothetical protein
MSSIPSSAFPHAGPATETEDEGGETLTMAQRAADLAQRASQQAGKLVDLARDNPKTAIAAGAAVAAGVAAAAAIPMVRAARAKSAANGKAAPATATARAPARKRTPARKSAAKKT